ncbi:hypothetical protein [Mycolicibacterium goodii]|uniref:Uncharacterized protein n=1 Tax=Mycolicibacterium goodii TaxID=134601 RepID=A0ABS6HXN6_MYCGD|nr:hypothetical protein [Mycolicibacterium goodii]MBU8841399.1 hypothetical protein [Mycolicibacterium goodii]
MAALSPAAPTRPIDPTISWPLNADTLRGSGQALHPAVATALGVDPGGRRD